MFVSEQESTGKRMGRPKGAKSKPPEDYIQTKITLAEMALDNLKLRLRLTEDADERQRITNIVDDLVARIKSELSD